LVESFQQKTRRAGTGKQNFMNCNRNAINSKRIVVFAEDLDMIRLGAVAAGGRMMPSRNLFSAKTILVGWMSGN
jgi:hypothetical protein